MIDQFAPSIKWRSFVNLSKPYFISILLAILMPLKLFTQGESCQCPSGFNEINIIGGLNGALASDVFSTYNHNVNNTCISVTGVLILDTYMNFTNCRFFMNSGAQIVVRNYSLLGSYSCTYKSCSEYMWEGILFEDYGWTIFKNSTIQDALFALGTNGNTQTAGMLIQKSIFRNNFIGIYNPRESGGMRIISVFIGNRFVGSTPLKTPPPTSNEDPYYESGSYSFAGIISFEDALLIGRPNAGISDRNYFENLYCGISGIDNVLTIQGSYFQDIPGLAYVNQLNSLSAALGITGNTGVSEIYTPFGSGSLPLVSVSGFGKDNSDPPSFTNVSLAVYCNGADCLVSNNRMLSVVTGLNCVNVMAHKFPGGIKMNNNKITHTGTGVFIGNCSSSYIEVSNNDLNSATTASVFSTQLLFRNNKSCDIHVVENYLYPAVQLFGMSFEMSPAVQVSNNHVNWQSPGPINGRTSYNFTYSPSIISCNSTSNQGYENTQTNAFRLSNSENSILDCNIANYHYRGFWVLANNMDADLLTNSVSDCTYGWYYASTGISGYQENKGNSFSQSFEVGAQHDGSNRNILLSQYLVRPLGNNDHPYGSQYNIYTPNGIEDWFITDSAILPPVCMLNCGTNMFADPHNNDDIINWPNGPDWFNQESRWEVKAYLVRRILDNPALLSEYPALDTFYTESADSTYLNLKTIEYGMDHLFDADSGQQVTLSQFAQVRRDLLDQIDSIHVLIDDEDSATLLILLQVKDSLIAVLDSAGIILNEVVNEISLNALQNAEILLMENNNLNLTKTYESNAMIVNRIVLRSLIEQEEFTSEEKDSLQAIADQCAYSSGVAVYRARAIMSQYSFQDQDDELICFPPIPLLSNSNKIYLEHDYYVLPNPAENSITFFKDNKMKLLELSLINEQGKVLMKFGRNTIPERLDIQSLPGGLYFLGVQTELSQHFIKFIKI